MKVTGTGSSDFLGVIERGSDSGVGLTTGSLIGWLKDNPGWLESELQNTGALLFRGFGFSGAAKLQEFVDTSSSEIIDYTGGLSPRYKVRDNIYISTYAPRTATIPLHCEICYLERIPKRLFFMCDKAARKGGQTPIADMADVADAIDPGVIDEFEKRGVMFVISLPATKGLLGLKSWHDMFDTDDRDEAESIAVVRGYDVRWGRKDRMGLMRRHPALIRHPHSGRRIWFNQTQIFHDSWSWELRNCGLSWVSGMLRWIEERRADRPIEQASHQAAFGDGKTIPRDMVMHIRETLWKHAVYFDWEDGDLVVLDNLRIGHGRMPYRGDRRILVAMGESVSASDLHPGLNGQASESQPV